MSWGYSGITEAFLFWREQIWALSYRQSSSKALLAQDLISPLFTGLQLPLGFAEEGCSRHWGKNFCLWTVTEIKEHQRLLQGHLAVLSTKIKQPYGKSFRITGTQSPQSCWILGLFWWFSLSVYFFNWKLMQTCCRTLPVWPQPIPSELPPHGCCSLLPHLLSNQTGNV